MHHDPTWPERPIVRPSERRVHDYLFIWLHSQLIEDLKRH